VTDDIAANERRAVLLIAMVTVPLALIIAGIGSAAGAAAIAIVIGVGLALAWAIAAWWAGPAVVVRAIDARPADPVTHARLYNLVGGLAIAAGVPAPRLLVVETDTPNALALGVHPRRAALAVTTGLLAELDRIELEGVVARELVRIRRHDTTPATVAVPLLVVLQVMRPLAAYIADSAVGSGHVLAADLGAVALTRYPPGLARALGKIRVDGLVSASRTTAHLWLEPPLAGAGPDIHPPLDERIEALREL
jgi:heat shock protein HtpX